MAMEAKQTRPPQEEKVLQWLDAGLTGDDVRAALINQGYSAQDADLLIAAAISQRASHEAHQPSPERRRIAVSAGLWNILVGIALFVLGVALISAGVSQTAQVAEEPGQFVDEVIAVFGVMLVAGILSFIRGLWLVIGARRL